MFGQRAHIFVLLVVLAYVCSAARAASVQMPQDSAFYQHYPYILLVDENDSTEISDDDFLDYGGKIVFPVNRYDLPKGDSLLTQLVEEVIPQISKDSLQLLRVMLRGAASPEGSYANNRMLSRRYEALLNFLSDRLDVSDATVLSTQAEAEDYRTLLVMMKRAGDPAFGQVQTLCNRHLPRYEYTLLKRHLRKIDGGRL